MGKSYESSWGNKKRVKYNERNEKNDDSPRVNNRRLTRSKNHTSGGKTHLPDNDARKMDVSSIPIEILFEIMSYLDCRDLYSLRGVSKFFERLVLEPSVWTAYEVKNTERSTAEVIEDLKRMPHLRRISIEARNDCDDILRQLSCSNKKLQKLNVSNCTGTSANLYLRPAYLIRILERCTRLHTITIRGSRFRGLKFYRILGNMGQRLRFVSTSTTGMQFRTFAKHVSKVDDNESGALCSMCPGGSRRWGPLRYYMVEKSDRSKIGFVSYYYHDFLYVDLRPNPENKTTIATPSLSPVTMCS